MYTMLIRKAAVIGLLFFYISGINAQINPLEAKDSIVDRFLNQALLYPQEKIHLQIDRPHYVSDERLWFKAFLVNAMLHTPDRSSRYVYVELIDPLQKVKSRVMVKAEDGSFQGHIDLPEDLVEGNYILRAYTSYMKNLDEGYWPHVPVYISAPQSAVISIVPQFEYPAGNKVSLSLSINNIENNTDFSPTVLSVTYDNKTLIPKKKDGMLYCTFARKEGEDILLVECDKYKKYITIPNPQEDYEVTFFPEGGNTISEAVNCVAFKSLYGNGKPADITGYVTNEKGDSITNFTTYHDGMGYFFMKPEKGIKYYTISKNEAGIEKKTELPVAQNTAGLRITNIKNEFHLSISKSPDINIDSLYIVMHTRGIPYYVQKWNTENEDISFQKGKFLSGILHILLINSEGQTLSERLVFCNNDDQAVLNKRITSEIKTRDRVSVNLQVSDQQENPLEADLLVSVTDDKDVDASKNNSISSSLLLTSDIRGYIPNPDYYLEKNNLKASKALDMLMLTHGWRRYNIPEVIQHKYAKPCIPVEVGQEISGQALGGFLKAKPAKDAQVSIFSKQTGFFDVTTTDNEGRFHFRDFEFPDSTVYFIQAISQKGSSGVELVLEKDTIPPIETAIYIAEGIKNRTKTDNANDMDNYAYIGKVNKKYTYENGMRLIYLNPIEIKAKKTVVEKSFYDRLSDKTFSQEFIEETGAATLSDVIRYMSGFIVENGNIYSTRISALKGREIALVFVDGIRITPFGGFEGSGNEVEQPIILDAQPIDDLIPIENIQEINVFKSSGKSLILGVSGGGPVIMITTKKGGNIKDIPPDNIAKIQPLGYQRPVEFYSPRYDTDEKKNSPNPDLRTTIYWNPALRQNENGKAYFDFYAADFPGEYTMIIEGITKDGKIVRSVEKLKVLKPE